MNIPINGGVGWKNIPHVCGEDMLMSVTWESTNKWNYNTDKIINVKEILTMLSYFGLIKIGFEISIAS